MRTILILLAVLILGGWWVRRQDKQSAGVRPPPAPGSGRALPPPEKMVQCAECGTYLPISEALQAGEAHFCSASHRQAYEIHQR